MWAVTELSLPDLTLTNTYNAVHKYKVNELYLITFYSINLLHPKKHTVAPNP